jgi:hypothetical protein
MTTVFLRATRASIANALVSAGAQPTQLQVYHEARQVAANPFHIAVHMLEDWLWKC